MPRQDIVQQKIIAFYCRISLDDGGDNKSMSSSNQKLMLKEFAEIFFLKHNVRYIATTDGVDSLIRQKMAIAAENMQAPDPVPGRRWYERIGDI